MNKQQKMMRKELLANLRELGGEVFTFKESDVTVLVVPAVQGGNHKHCHVAVALCSKFEPFKRKRGEYEALRAWNRGQYLPVRVPYYSVELFAVADTVRELVE
jgi:hypothetical protein